MTALRATVALPQLAIIGVRREIAPASPSDRIAGKPVVIPPTHFAVPDAVDAWDAEFRWRDLERLHDLTVDDTWRRVAERAASIEGPKAPLWAHHFIESFSRWRLLPEEHILRGLGTDRPTAAAAEPGAVLDVASFVVRQPTGGSCFDRERFVATAALAVRFLDDVAAATDAGQPPRRLRIGLIGLANALQALDLDYDTLRGRQQAAQVAKALAEGCLRGSVELADERGPRVPAPDCLARLDCMRRRGMPDWLVQRAQRIGLCHDALTAIDPHPALARLANGVADAVDPLPVTADSAMSRDCGQLYVAELEMRAELQPWIDEPISYPLRWEAA